MQRIETDIFISGGGIAGLVAAAALSADGFSVVLADPSPPPSSGGEATSDLRSTAYLEPALRLLDRIGLWEPLRAHATPLQTLRVIDCAGDPPSIRTDRAFQSLDLGHDAFGWNLPNWLTRHLLAGRLAADPGVTLAFGVGFRALLTRENAAIVMLDDGRQVRARLAIAADGRDSPLREAAGLQAKTTRYGQKALAFSVAHDLPHDNVSTELYLSGGAFTLVPLADHNGHPASAVVWMNDAADAAGLMAMEDSAFADAATLRSCGVLGQLRPLTARQSWPVITREATSLVAERVALIAEAAHVLPPIGAQGLNTSLNDVIALTELARAQRDSLGSREFLDAYASARLRDMRVRTRAIDLYNRVCRSSAPPVQSLRSLGLRLAHDVVPLRRGLMRAGLGD